MIENYLKQIESYITPKNYKPEYNEINIKNIENIQNNQLRDEELPAQLSAENRKKIEEYLKNQKFEGKGKIYDRILDNNSINNKLTTNTNQTTKNNLSENFNYISTTNISRMIPSIPSSQTTNIKEKIRPGQMRNKSLSPTKNIGISDNLSSNNYETSGNETSTFQKKIHELNIKSMNYRYEISQLKQLVDTLQQIILQKDTTIQKLEKQRENDAKYLLKLETMISQKQKPEIPTSNNNLTKQESFLQASKNEEEFKSLDLNFNDKKEVKEFILKNLRELKQLKEFQTNVYEISKNYDSINENIIEGMNLIQSLINLVNQSQRLDGGQYQLMKNNFEKITENIQKTLEIKQLEYNLLIKNKENEIQCLNDEFLKANQNLELMRQDRMHDQMIINDLQTQNAFLNMKVSEFIEGTSTIKNENCMIKQNKNINKRGNPMRDSVEKMVKNFEKNLDMRDRNNINFVENLNNKLKY